jgi:hypothetical protein
MRTACHQRYVESCQPAPEVPLFSSTTAAASVNIRVEILWWFVKLRHTHHQPPGYPVPGTADAQVGHASRQTPARCTNNTSLRCGVTVAGRVLE